MYSVFFRSAGYWRAMHHCRHRAGDCRPEAVRQLGVSAICDKPFEAGSIRRLISESLTR